MTQELTTFTQEALTKQHDMIAKKYDIAPQYAEIFRNALVHIHARNLAPKLEENFLTILKTVIKRDDISDADKKKLEQVAFEFDYSTIAESTDFINIRSINIEDEKILVVFGTKSEVKTSTDDIVRIMKNEMKFKL